MTDVKPLFPVLGFSAAILDGAVVLKLEFATTPETYRQGVGEVIQYVMMPDAALAIGEALKERGGLAERPVS